MSSDQGELNYLTYLADMKIVKWLNFTIRTTKLVEQMGLFFNGGHPSRTRIFDVQSKRNKQHRSFFDVWSPKIISWPTLKIPAIFRRVEGKGIITFVVYSTFH